MRLSQILILVSSVTLLSACGSSKSGSKPTMVDSKVTAKKEDGKVFLSAQGQCKVNTEAMDLKTACQTLHDRIADANDVCHDSLAFTFNELQCSEVVNTSQIDAIISRYQVNEQGQGLILEEGEKTVVETTEEEVDRLEGITVNMKNAVIRDVDEETGDILEETLVENPEFNPVPASGAGAEAADLDTSGIKVVHLSDLESRAARARAYTESFEVTTEKDPKTHKLVKSEVTKQKRDEFEVKMQVTKDMPDETVKELACKTYFEKQCNDNWKVTRRNPRTCLRNALKSRDFGKCVDSVELKSRQTIN